MAGRPRISRARQIPPPDTQSLHILDVRAPSHAPEGGTINAQVDVQNTAAGCAEFDIRWLVDGQVMGEESISGAFCHGAGETHTYSTPVGPMPAGDNEVCVELRNIVIGDGNPSEHTPSACLSVLGSGIDGSDVSVASCVGDEKTPQGQPASFDLSIENANPQMVSVDAVILADGQEIGRSQKHIPAGETRLVAVEGGQGLAIGEYAITAEIQNVQVASSGTYR